MGFIKIAVAIVVALVAMLVGFMWDYRDADMKADSIMLGWKHSFDQRFDFDLPEIKIEGEGGEGEVNLVVMTKRVCYFDLPDGYAEGDAAPILFLIHGKASMADDMKTFFGEKSVARARKEGFVVVYPVGVLDDEVGIRTWNAGNIHLPNNADDVGYFSRVVDHLAANFNADPQSVFLSGMSNGGFMSNRLACAWANESQHIRVRAIAPVMGGMAKMKYDKKCIGESIKWGMIPLPTIYMFNQETCPYETWNEAPSHFECEAVKDLPVMIINNGKDVLVPFNGVVVSGKEEGIFPPVEYTLRFFAEANGCSYDVDDNTVGRTETFRQVSEEDPDDITTCHSLQNCRKANTTVCVSHKSGHNWVWDGIDSSELFILPSRLFGWLMSPFATTFDTNHEILSFFAQHRKLELSD
jgi:poly(3-hydroxybutyrate) depolymerase